MIAAARRLLLRVQRAALRTQITQLRMAAGLITCTTAGEALLQARLLAQASLLALQLYRLGQPAEAAR